MEHFTRNYFLREPDVPRGVSLADVGEEVCESGHSFGGMRVNFVMHYVCRGMGVFHLEKRQFHPSEGQLFFIFPGLSNHYRADDDDPWHYRWVSFYGRDVLPLLSQAGISPENPLVRVKNPERLMDDFTALLELCEEGDLRKNEMGRTGLLLSLLSSGENTGGGEGQDVPQEMRADHYCRRVRRFVELNYQSPIGVADIARFLALDRTYLSTLWKGETGGTLRDYLADYRVKRACYYLNSTGMSIKEIAFSVGYREYPVFERLFKRRTGLTPRQWRAGNR